MSESVHNRVFDRTWNICLEKSSWHCGRSSDVHKDLKNWQYGSDYKHEFFRLIIYAPWNLAPVLLLFRKPGTSGCEREGLASILMHIYFRYERREKFQLPFTTPPGFEYLQRKIVLVLTIATVYLHKYQFYKLGCFILLVKWPVNNLNYCGLLWFHTVQSFLKQTAYFKLRAPGIG